MRGRMWGAPPYSLGQGEMLVSKGSPEPCVWGRRCHSSPRQRGQWCGQEGGVHKVSPSSQDEALGTPTCPLQLRLCSVLIDH